MGAFSCFFHASDNRNNAGSNNSSLCPKSFFKSFKNKRISISNRGETRAAPLPNSNIHQVLNNPSNASGSNGGSVAKSNEAGARQEKGASRSRVQPEPDSGIKNTFSDDEDVCPTCLEEYTQENPKIVAECTHHYHLGCIYDWMERSKTCPACAELMLFDE